MLPGSVSECDQKLANQEKESAKILADHEKESAKTVKGLKKKIARSKENKDVSVHSFQKLQESLAKQTEEGTELKKQKNELKMTVTEQTREIARLQQILETMNADQVIRYPSGSLSYHYYSFRITLTPSPIVFPYSLLCNIGEV